MKNKKHTLLCALSLALLAISASTNASVLQDKMDSVFGEMSNVSQPGVFDGQRRGVISGGSIYTRSRIMDTQLVNISTPSFDAGCGGIDIFGGSFSFINADQFVQLLRSIAANAKGYAFELALNAVSPEIGGTIRRLQSVIQSLNQMNANSCQLAKGLVSDVASAFGMQKDMEYSLIGTAKGVYSDFMTAWNGTDGTSTSQEVAQKAPEEVKNLTGNIVWKELKTNHATAWFVGAANENEEASVLMSVSGSVILQPPSDNNGKGQYVTSVLESTVTFKELLNGGDVEIYKCDEAEQCLKPTKQKVRIRGFVTQIEELLRGSGTSVGIIKKFGSLNGNKFTAKEENLVTHLPSSIGAGLRQIATSSPGTAIDYANNIAYAVSAVFAHELIQNHLDAVSHAVRSNSSPEIKDVMQQIDKTRTRLRDDYDSFAREHMTQDKLLGLFADIQSMATQPIVWSN